MKKKVVIVGCNGQDGKILDNYLKKLDYNVWGLSKENSDITSRRFVENLIKKLKPDQIYFLAAYHHSSENRKNIDLELNYKINYLSVLFFLEGLKKFSQTTKFFFASSSFIFKPSKVRQTEKTIMEPGCHYSIAKVASMKLCDFYRTNENIFTSCGILYNHESDLRKNIFLSKKIISHAIRNFHGSDKKLILHNLNFKADWGYAPDYIDAMYKILKYRTPKNFIISSGNIFSVRDFAKTAYDYLDLDYKKYVTSKENFKVLNYRLGDASLLKKLCKWKPSVNFKQMIAKLISDKLNSNDFE